MPTQQSAIKLAMAGSPEVPTARSIDPTLGTPTFVPGDDTGNDVTFVLTTVVVVEPPLVDVTELEAALLAAAAAAAPAWVAIFLQPSVENAAPMTYMHKIIKIGPPNIRSKPCQCPSTMSFSLRGVVSSSSVNPLRPASTKKR